MRIHVIRAVFSALRAYVLSSRTRALAYLVFLLSLVTPVFDFVSHELLPVVGVLWADHAYRSAWALLSSSTARLRGAT